MSTKRLTDMKRKTPKKPATRRSTETWAGLLVKCEPLREGGWLAKGGFLRGPLDGMVFHATGATKDDARQQLRERLSAEALKQMWEADFAEKCAKKLTLASLAGGKKR